MVVMKLKADLKHVLCSLFFAMFYISCVTTTEFAEMPTFHETCYLKIVPGTIITELDKKPAQKGFIAEYNTWYNRYKHKVWNKVNKDNFPIFTSADERDNYYNANREKVKSGMSCAIVNPFFAIHCIYEGLENASYDKTKWNINKNPYKEFNPWKGRFWQYKQKVIRVQIEAGMRMLKAEAEFDPPIWQHENPNFGTKQKIYVIDYSEYVSILPENINSKKYILYQGRLTNKFNFEPNHEYVAQVVLNENNEFVLYIWDSKDHPYGR
ncbi:MAG: hypothetical protein Ta2G_02280 [Termitinemataceae bacterium]|nr:MAG: hypothetical protein Ta2G_02280 [Termitinemataceae bacterium]